MVTLSLPWWIVLCVFVALIAVLAQAAGRESIYETLVKEQFGKILGKLDVLIIRFYGTDTDQIHLSLPSVDKPEEEDRSDS